MPNRTEVEACIKELEDQGGDSIAWGKLLRILLEAADAIFILQGQVRQLQGDVRELKNGDRGGQSW